MSDRDRNVAWVRQLRWKLRLSSVSDQGLFDMSERAERAAYDRGSGSALEAVEAIAAEMDRRGLK